MSHMKHNSQWTDEAGVDVAFDAANANLTASLSMRQQQMYQTRKQPTQNSLFS